MISKLERKWSRKWEQGYTDNNKEQLKIKPRKKKLEDVEKTNS